MKKLTLQSIMFIMVLVLGTSSCTKKEDKNTTSSEDNSIAESAFDDILRVSESIAKEENLETKRSEGSFRSLWGNCANVSIDKPWPDSTYPKTVTVDFGLTNCEGTDKRMRRGKFTIVMTGPYREENTVITVTPDQYYLNDYKIEGTKVTTNNGRNTTGNLSFTIDVTGANITAPNGDQWTWESTRTREWIEGENTTGFLGILDDVYSITGRASGTNRKGITFTVDITDPLIFPLICFRITQGVIEIQPEGLKLRTVDYGEGECDNKITVTIGKKTYNIGGL